jgi:mRNA interferase HigB
MRVISLAALKRFWARYPISVTTLREWYGKTDAARWGDPADVKATFPQVDFVKVASGNTVYVFNIQRFCRLIAAIHFDHPRVFVLRVLTHKEYDSNRWKEQL